MRHPIVVCVFVFVSIGAGALSIDGGDAAVHPFMAGASLSSLGQVVEDYVRLEGPGAYRLSAQISSSGAAKFALTVDHLSQGMFDAASSEAKEYEVQVTLDAGVHAVGVCLLNESSGTLKDIGIQVKQISIVPAAGQREPVRADESDWNAEMQAREQAVLRAAPERIAACRMGKAVVRVVDPAGKPLAGARVRAVQTRHAFLFGANLFGWDKFGGIARETMYKRYFADLFNYATLPFYWPIAEPIRGKPRFSTADAMASWCDWKKIEMKGHPLLWNNKYGIPMWAQGWPAADVRKAWVEQAMGRFKDRILTWDVVNEPANCPAPDWFDGFQWAKDAAPQSRRIVNEYGQFYHGNPIFFEMVKDALAKGAPIDAIGFQAHAPANMAWPLNSVWDMLDRYAALGKPLHITEFIVPSNGEKVVRSVWRDVWDEFQQADYAEAFYRICFSHPAVEAISWWDVCEIDAWIKGGSLLHADLKPKPIYDRLKKLLHEEWRTQAEGVTDAEGRFEFSGYFGEYSLQAESGALRAEATEQLSKGQENAWMVTASGG